MQILTFMVIAIIGAVFASIQGLIAGNGAAKIHTNIGEIYFGVDCDFCRKVFV